MMNPKITSFTPKSDDRHQIEQGVDNERRKQQLDTLRLLNDYYNNRGSWYAVIAGWAREAHLHKKQPHKDIDVLVPASLEIPDTEVGVDFIRMEGNPQEGLWISVVPPNLLKFYIPPIAAEPVEVNVEGVSFKTLKPEALLLTMLGEGKIPIPAWTPHFGNRQSREKFASGWRDLKAIEDPEITQQMIKMGLGFYLVGRQIQWLTRVLKGLIRK